MELVRVEVFKEDAERLRRMGASLPQALHQLLTHKKNKPSGFHTSPGKKVRPDPLEASDGSRPLAQL